MSVDETTRLFVVHVSAANAPRVAELLFEVGFAGLMEEAEDECVVFSTSSDETERETTFARACEAEGIECETSHKTFSTDWRIEWTRYLKPVQVTESLRLVPAAAPEVRDPYALYLEPTLAFGFGEHPTTRMALRWLERRVAGRRVLDFGCGTGVLALGAVHFGALSAIGIDTDADSVSAAQANARANALHDRCAFSGLTLRQLSQDFDVVVCNIDAVTLARCAGDLCARLSTGGHIAATGLLEAQTDAVCEAFQHCGKPLFVADGDEDWCLLSTSRT
jgi:ribosomal protein L11 methyltransferase